MSTQEIGVIISQGLSETYRNQPKNPIDFLGKWLLHQTEIGAQKEKDEETSKSYQEHRGYRDLAQKLAEGEEKERQEAQLKIQKKEEAFFSKIDNSVDLEDNLQDMVNYLQEYTNSTSVFVAKLVPQINEIEEDDDDSAHIIKNAPLHLDIYHVSPKECNFVLRKTVQENEGVVHDIFRDVEEPPKDNINQVQNEGEGETEANQEPEEPKPQHVIIKEVVREPRIKYFKVPRLGSLLCIRLNYES